MNYTSPILTFIGLTAGIGLSLCVLTFKKKQECLKEYRRKNSLETIRMIYAIKNLLTQKDNIRIYKQLSALDQTFRFPDLDSGESVEEKEQIQKEKEKLDNYLSILEMCSLLVQTESISRQQIHIIIGDRLEDIKSHNELYEYICRSTYYYKDLIWLLKG